MTGKRSFGIVGGGIGGLTLAIALQRNGFEVNVYENAPEFRPLGAGIVLAANALKALREIRLDEEIRAAGKELKRFNIKDQRGNVLTSTDAEKINKKYGLVNTLALHRGDLHQVLLRNLRGNGIQFGKGCKGFESTQDKVLLHFNDGSTAEEDFVIAADGIHSVFRKQLVPQVSMRYSGYTCWRAVVDNLSSQINTNEATETWGAGKRFGMVPLSDNRIYWYATIDAKSSDQSIRRSNPRDLQKLFTDFHNPVSEVFSVTKEEQLIQNDICDLSSVERFAFGRIVLLGDAAHATTPNMGQGACMAIEDAIVLANCIKKEEHPERAFKLFESHRIERTRKIVNDSYNMGKVAQLKNPLLIKLRNTAMRLAPESLSEKQLSFLYDVSFS